MLQILSAKARSSPRFVCRKFLNSVQVNRASFAERHYIDAIVGPPYHAKTRQQNGYDWVRWLRRFQSGPYTADKNGSSPGENSLNISRALWLSAVALKILLGSKWEVKPGSGSLSRLS